MRKYLQRYLYGSMFIGCLYVLFLVFFISSCVFKSQSGHFILKDIFSNACKLDQLTTSYLSENGYISPSCSAG